VVDPKHFSDDMFVTIDTAVTGRDHVIIPPNSFALAATVEQIEVPRDVLAICVGKSTYARCGIIVNVTPLEPEWRGHVTLEISNTTPLPAKIYANEGIAQMVFLKAERVCAVSYQDKNGKYQDQRGLTLPRVD
jgi:dCTP deaminase